MWVRGLLGVVLCAVGAVWVGQGTNAIHGSGMSGHGQYTVLGGLVVAVGLGLLGWAWRISRRRGSEGDGQNPGFPGQPRSR